MYRFDPNSLSRWSNGKWTDSPSNGVNGFTIDSRKVSSGDMFVAIKADRDGHDFLDQATKEGAVAGLVAITPASGSAFKLWCADR